MQHVYLVKNWGQVITGFYATPESASESLPGARNPARVGRILKSLEADGYWIDWNGTGWSIKKEEIR